MGIGATLAVALSRSFAVNHGYWMSLTLVFILQPYFAATWQRTVERVLGSVAGAIGASLLGLLLSTPLSVALAVLPIALGTFAARTVNHALFTFFLTSQFVLVSHIQQPDLHEPELAALRNSVLGAVLALLIGFLLWPEKAPRRAGALRALQRHADYVLALVLEKSGEAAESPRRIVELRRQACLAADNAQASLERLQQNPAPRQQGRHGGNPAQCHAPGDRRRHRAGNPARPARRQRGGIRAARPAKPWRGRCTRDGEPEPGGRVMPVPSAVGLAQPGLPPPGTHRPPGAAGAAATRQAPAGLVLAPDGAN